MNSLCKDINDVLPIGRAFFPTGSESNLSKAGGNHDVVVRFVFIHHHTGNQPFIAHPLEYFEEIDRNVYIKTQLHNPQNFDFHERGVYSFQPWHSWWATWLPSRCSLSDL